MNDRDSHRVYALTHTQIGAMGEAIAACGLLANSGGRLSPFKPMADDDGIDLLVYDKKTGRAASVQVKSRDSRKLGKADTIQFDVRRQTFSEHALSFLLAVLLDLETCEVKRAWLIPMEDLAAVSNNKSDKFVIVPSAKETSKDRYTPYRFKGIDQATRQLVDYLEEH